MAGWIGVDLDGTLAKYDAWRGELHIGEPIPAMVQRVKEWLAKGITVKIVTARVSVGTGDRSQSTVAQIKGAIAEWTHRHIGASLEAVCCKDFAMIELWDDRAIQVVPNSGQTIAEYYGIDEAAEIAKKLGHGRAHPGEPEVSNLTQTHRRILVLVLAGKVNKEIAEETGLAYQTVRNRLAEAYRFFGVTTTRQLIPIIDRVRSELGTKD